MSLRVIELDASGWKDPVEFYDAVYDALGDPRAMPLPHRFGHGIDALREVLMWGGMAYLGPPYAFHISNLSRTPAEVQEEVRYAAEIINREGVDEDVSIRLTDDQTP